MIVGARNIYGRGASVVGLTGKAEVLSGNVGVLSGNKAGLSAHGDVLSGNADGLSANVGALSEIILRCRPLFWTDRECFGLSGNVGGLVWRSSESGVSLAVVHGALHERG